MNINLQTFVIILIIIFVLIFIYYRISTNNMTYVKSNIDEHFYLVRNVQDKQEASNELARIRNNIINISDYLYNNINNEQYKKFVPYIKILHNKVRNIIIVESSQDSIYTSYSVNKGEQIVFCLRSRHTGNKLHDMNLMMYVVLHELSHVACPIYDNHGELFKEIFTFLTTTAISLGFYNKINFDTHPEEYCGLIISKSII